jgi:hypothetical protein
MRLNPPSLGKAERKYLERYAENEARSGTLLAETVTPYSDVVVIPSYGEYETLLQTLDSVPPHHSQKPLIVLVVNQREDCPDWARTANESLLAHLRSGEVYDDGIAALGPGIEHHTRADHDLILIDRTQSELCLPKRQGVGLARKIGADFAFGLWAAGGLTSDWIHCTDADARLPEDYFERATDENLEQGPGRKPIAPAALVHDFLHTTEDAHDGGIAILQYEVFLRYYVLGLRSARSPYAFHTIGSTLVVNPCAYAQVRGFPKREAAEDFHLLAKLAKVGRVRPTRGQPILLSGRASTRVPFGTGNAVSMGHARAERGEEFFVYDPRNFIWLGVWLDALGTLAANPSAPVASTLERAVSGSEVDPLELQRILERLCAIEGAQKVLQVRGDTLRSLNENFDALATLKLIHALRDDVHPDIPLDRALRQAEFIDVDVSFDPGSAASLEDQRKRLAKLEAAGQ